MSLPTVRLSKISTVELRKDIFQVLSAAFRQVANRISGIFFDFQKAMSLPDEAYGLSRCARRTLDAYRTTPCSVQKKAKRR